MLNSYTIPSTTVAVGPDAPLSAEDTVAYLKDKWSPPLLSTLVRPESGANGDNMVVVVVAASMLRRFVDRVSYDRAMAEKEEAVEVQVGGGNRSSSGSAIGENDADGRRQVQPRRLDGVGD